MNKTERALLGRGRERERQSQSAGGSGTSLPPDKSHVSASEILWSYGDSELSEAGWR